jgi:hypothetical protein
MKMVRCVLFALMILAVQSCTSPKVVDVKSPCVSGKDGPCGPRRPVNTWLLEYNS